MNKTRHTALLLFFLAASLNVSMSYADIRITKKNGGKKGYKLVDETHNGTDHSLTCKGSGYEKCAWAMPPSERVDVDAVMQRVDEHIKKKRKSGRDSLNGVPFTWQGKNRYNQEIVILTDE